MEKTGSELIWELIRYGVSKGLCKEVDRVYLANRLAETLAMDALEPDEGETNDRLVSEILSDLCDLAEEKKLIAKESLTERDLFDTKLMGIITPWSSDVIAHFDALYAYSPKDATDWYYDFSRNTNYIRTDRIKKDLKWIYAGKYGDLDITVNLSKPEKDPKAIAAAKKQKQSGYPACALCRENEGFAGSLTRAARQSHRLIPIELTGSRWFLQYSPYVYYNEHCIVLSEHHTPMKINRETFTRLFDFLTLFPHYFIGSNADLPIVGGSILTHEHMQGGRYTFAIERAEEEIPISFGGFGKIEAAIVHWPMSVIRLRSTDRDALETLAEKILLAWRDYSDQGAGVLAESEGEPHNTITPIARRRGEAYELDLVLRNNRTTEEHPLGIFHPHADKHNIKKENIGLIEVMGLAILPARLKKEMERVAEVLAAGGDLTASEETAKHAAWVSSFADRYDWKHENISQILNREIGRTFEGVLEDAGVYPCTKKGREDFLRFIKTVSGKERKQ